MTLRIAIGLALSLAGAGCKNNDPGADVVKTFTELRDRVCQCTDQACIDKVTKESVGDALKNPGPSGAKLDEATRNKLDQLTAETTTCMTKFATPAPAPAPTPAANDHDAEAAAGDLPAECAAWKAAVDKLAGCDKLPAQDRANMKKTFDNAAAKWATMTTPEQKATIASECKAASEITTSATKVCQ
ncbi:MAG: hypothetical protein AB7P03_13695 [Kofleriaceae bacterium]